MNVWVLVVMVDEEQEDSFREGRSTSKGTGHEAEGVWWALGLSDRCGRGEAGFRGLQ